MIVSATRQAAAILVDIENFVVKPKEDRFFYPEFTLTPVINSLRIYIGRRALYAHPDWSRIYLQSRAFPPFKIDRICQAARQQHFKLRWSIPGEPAERLLIQDIAKALGTKSSLCLPSSIYILSGDGAVIETVASLRQRSCDVTVVAFAQRINQCLKQCADTFITMEKIFAEVCHP